jgi:hypothetical protein
MRPASPCFAFVSSARRWTSYDPESVKRFSEKIMRKQGVGPSLTPRSRKRLRINLVRVVTC